MMPPGCKALVRLATSASTATRSPSTTPTPPVPNASLNSPLRSVVISVTPWNPSLAIVYEHSTYGTPSMKTTGSHARSISALGSYASGRNTRTSNFGGSRLPGTRNGA